MCMSHWYDRKTIWPKTLFHYGKKVLGNWLTYIGHWRGIFDVKNDSFFTSCVTDFFIKKTKTFDCDYSCTMLSIVKFVNNCNSDRVIKFINNEINIPFIILFTIFT